MPIAAKTFQSSEGIILPENDIADLMNAILIRLMPLPNPALWAVYEEFQEWKIAIEWQHPSIGIDNTVNLAKSVLKKLELLSDRALAEEIADTVKHYTEILLENKAGLRIAIKH